MKTSKKHSDSIIITRKIRLNIDIHGDEKERKQEAFDRLYGWQRCAYKAANLVASQLYFMDQEKELMYFRDDIKMKLDSYQRSENGMLNTSWSNVTYRSVAQKLKGELPTAMITCINRNVFFNYKKEKAEYFKGIRSLRSYKSNMPIPFTPQSLYNLKYDSQRKEFTFSLFSSKKYKIPFKTYLGSDKNDNRTILDRCIKELYKIVGSSVHITKSGIYLYLSMQIPKKENELDPNKCVNVSLSALAPLVVNFEENQILIGDNMAFVNKRKAIQEGLRRRQWEAKYSKGGRGTKHKLKTVKKFEDKEKNLVDTYVKQVAFKLVDYCIKNKIGKVVLNNFEELTKEAQKEPLILRNWSYANFGEKITYKCRMNGIEIYYN